MFDFLKKLFGKKEAPQALVEPVVPSPMPTSSVEIMMPSPPPVTKLPLIPETAPAPEAKKRGGKKTSKKTDNVIHVPKKEKEVDTAWPFDPPKTKSRKTRSKE